MPNPVGAPTKFTEEVKDKIIAAIRKGAPYEIACDYAGIDYSTYCKWQIKAKTYHIPEYVEFFDKVKQAKGHTALRWLDVLDKAMIDSWQPAAWKLERRYYKYFSNNAQLIEQEKRLIALEKKINGDKNNGREEAEELDTGNAYEKECIA